MVLSSQILGRLRAGVQSHGCVAVLAGAMMLAGCGQKGPLFLPLPPIASPVTAKTNSGVIPKAVTPASPASAPE